MTVTTREPKEPGPHAPAAPVGTPRPRKPKDRGAKFNEKHALKYGLSICSRSAKDGSVEMVMCKFCVAFGKESAADTNRKRRATANIKYFRQPFRADHYLSHLEINHRQKWAEYEMATGPDKEKFFSDQVEEIALAPETMPPPPFVAVSGALEALDDDERTGGHRSAGEADGDVAMTTAPSASSAAAAATTEGPSAAADGGATATTTTANEPDAMMAPPTRMLPVRLPMSEIEKDLVELLVSGMFFDPSEEVGVTLAHALDAFARKEDSENFDIAIKNQRLYDLAIKFVSSGASYRLTSRLVQCLREETKIGFYGGCSDLRVANYTRAIIASNLQRIAWMMRSSWAFTIATEAAHHQHTAYLDVRVRLWHGGALRDFHLITIPAFDEKPAPAIIQHLSKLFDVLDPRWRGKLLGTTANGGMTTGRNLATTGSQQGLAARLTGVVTKPGFYLIWSAINQLEIVAKNCISSLCGRSFFDDLLRVLSLVRQGPQTVFPVHDIPDLAGVYSTTRGFISALMRVLKWLIENYRAVIEYVERMGNVPALSPSWWVCAAIAHRLMAEVEYFMKKLLAMNPGPNLVNDQVQELCKLALIMSDVVGARRDLWDPRDATDASTAGSFLLTYQNAQQFIQNEGGPLAIEMFDTLRGVDRLHISKSVAEFAVGLVSSVAAIAQDGRHYCAESSGVTVNPPSVLPFNVHRMGKEAFLKLLFAQEERLRETYTAEEFRRIQSDYYYFQIAVQTEPILNGILKKHTRETDVSFAWSCLNNRFHLLQEFLGGLATVVPDVSAGTLGADLLYLNWEKPDYRQTMVDFALEGILHARQKMKIEVVDVNYLRAILRPAAPAAEARAKAASARGDGASRPAIPIDTATPAGGHRSTSPLASTATGVSSSGTGKATTTTTDGSTTSRTTPNSMAAAAAAAAASTATSVTPAKHTAPQSQTQEEAPGSPGSPAEESSIQSSNDPGSPATSV